MLTSSHLGEINHSIHMCVKVKVNTPNIWPFALHITINVLDRLQHLYLKILAKKAFSSLVKHALKEIKIK